MAQVLSEKVMGTLSPPAMGNRVCDDTEVRGFGVWATYAGARSFVVNDRARGRERRVTIGSHPD